MTKITFASDRTLTQALEEAVNNYFKENGIAQTGNWKLYLKTFFWFFLLIGSYIWLVFFTPSSVWGQIGFCALIGASLAGIGCNVAHDAAHNSYTKNTRTNEYLSYSFDFMGASSTLWKWKHNVAHHTYTNIEGHDEDFDAGILLRTSPNQKRYWFHYLQFLYAPILYTFLYILWVWKNDFEKMRALKVASTEIKGFSKKDRWIFLFSKVWWLIIFLVIPLFTVGFLKAVLGALIVCGFCGLILALIFQPSHVVEKAKFPIPNEDGYMDNNRVEHQLATTCDFATKSRIVTWLFGGLNFQVEHHLFPRISHIHYPKIHEVVKDVCAAYSKKVNVIPTFVGAEWCHFFYLFKLGTGRL